MTSPHDNFALWCSQELARVEDALTLWIAADAPANLGEPMRYAVLDGGKRLRPLLVLAAAQAAGNLAAGPAEAALRAGCAVELIHAYSLVHDDMPCMDDDVLRRGKPTVHVQFGQAQALLAGDALQALAFELLVPEGSAIPDAVQARLCRQLALAAGYNGMAGGQAIDLASVGKQLSREQLQQMHKLKTGALLQASVEMGATCAGIQGAALVALQQYGAALGLAFQVIDDVLDVVADSATLGKTAGKDADHGKPTYVSLMGLQAARDYAHELLAEAQQALAGSGLPQTAALAALADMVVRRSH
ncbi:farnesyl diphosphate synthase [Comamonas sp.]|uniref:polyprenyl synthetase family protein n=1 Tax=Comamonas TaxID=283 RepID=UPI00289C5E87|nr:farnesyl diphosphate synthase [Comamonas sp.]